MYESSDRQFLRTTTRAICGLNILQESRAVIFFLDILGVIEESSTFRLVLKGKVCRQLLQSSRLESPERISVNNFALRDTEDMKSGLFN